MRVIGSIPTDLTSYIRENTALSVWDWEKDNVNSTVASDIRDILSEDEIWDICYFEDGETTYSYSVVEGIDDFIHRTSQTVRIPSDYPMKDYEKCWSFPVSIYGYGSKAHLRVNDFYFTDGRHYRILSISDVLVDKEERWKSHWKNIEAITQGIAKKYWCDAIVSVLMAEDNQEKLVNNKIKAGYTIVNSNRTVKAMSDKWEEYKQDLVSYYSD